MGYFMILKMTDMGDEWVWMIKFNSLSGDSGQRVHKAHTGHVITANTLESLSPLTYITHNLRATINFKKKKELKKKWGHPLSWQIIGEKDLDQFT